MSGARARVADFWDDYFEHWLAGDDPDSEPLPGWKASYRGTGRGKVEVSYSADPFTGDLRGDKVPPRLVTLGLNPGVAYEPLQGREPRGIWMQRIAAVGYSRCLDRIPFDDDAWQTVHGGDSSYWVRLVNFARRWTGDDHLRPQQFLNMELYPWHSRGFVGSAMNPPADIIDRFVWQPVAEVDIPCVFAFGAPWRSVCKRLNLHLLAAFGPEDLDGGHGMGWNVRIYELPSGQRAVVSWQRGSGSPPGANRLPEFRRVVATQLPSE